MATVVLDQLVDLKGFQQFWGVAFIIRWVVHLPRPVLSKSIDFLIHSLPLENHFWSQHFLIGDLKNNFFVTFACQANNIKCNDKCDVSLQTPSVGFVKSSCIICKRSWPSLSLHTLKRSVTGSTCLFLLVHFYWNTVESFIIFFPTHKTYRKTQIKKI